MEFTYRSSKLKKEAGRYFLISASFDLSEKKEKYASNVDNVHFREHKQPKGNTCGSFFKNPEGIIISQNGQEEVIVDQEKIQEIQSQGKEYKNLSA